jgi:hypothetical protein
MRNILYSNGGGAVLPGDIVKYKKIFRTIDAVVVYVPGISPENKYFQGGDLDEVGVQTLNGRIYGIVVFEDGRLKGNILFQSRGLPGEVVPSLPDEIDDPYEDNI